MTAVKQVTDTGKARGTPVSQHHLRAQVDIVKSAVCRRSYPKMKLEAHMRLQGSDSMEG